MTGDKINTIFTDNTSTSFDDIDISAISNTNYSDNIDSDNKTCIMDDIDFDLNYFDEKLSNQ